VVRVLEKNSSVNFTKQKKALFEQFFQLREGESEKRNDPACFTDEKYSSFNV